ncbi:MAG TPA: helix-turn-helix domain-containing protein [Pseudonocardia sp.]|jgi:excisionase family DNA binding protein|nr:helix-turn-helix domain-containing protein [Pseudonocardia sp.]
MTNPDTRTAEIAGLLGRLAELLGTPPEQPQQPKRPMPKRVLLTPEEAGEALGVGRTTIYALLRTGDLESVQIGRLRRISLSAVEAYAEQLTKARSSTYVA